MTGPITSISPSSLPSTIRHVGEATSAGSFQNAFHQAVQSVEGAGQAASASVERFLAGDGEELHSTILATQRAELSFEMFLQMRNKVVSAYQEIMRMQM